MNDGRSRPTSPLTNLATTLVDRVPTRALTFAIDVAPDHRLGVASGALEAEVCVCDAVLTHPAHIAGRIRGRARPEQK